MGIDPVEGVIKQGLRNKERFRYDKQTKDGDLAYRYETKGFGVGTYREDSSKPGGFKPIKTTAANSADGCIDIMKKKSDGDLSQWHAITPPDKPILP